jgi:hypothetical protein
MTAKRILLTLATVAALTSLSTAAASAQALNCCGAWKQVPDGPGVRSNSAMAFDSSRGTLVLYGGQNGGTVLGETWELNGTGSWTLIPATGPGPRAGHALVYDGVRHRVLLFGGFDNTFTGQTDTWEWDGTSWTRVATTGPPSRNNPAAAYDSARGRVVLFGGQSLLPIGDTWEWDGTFWTQAASTGPAPRTWSAMAYDAAHSRVVLFGGKLQSGAELGDTWTWDGASWTQAAATGPSARFGHAMVFADSCSQVLLFGGTDSAAPDGDLWGWNGSAWTRQATTGPAARAFHAMAFDGARDLTVLVGGDTATATTGDVWQLSLPQLVVGNNTDSGVGSLREAIALSCPGGTITFASAVESPITLMSELSIEKNLTIQGPGASVLAISGSQKDRVFSIGQSQPGINVTLSGLTITEGQIQNLPIQSSPGQGGGIYFGGNTLTLASSTVSYNSVSGGSENFGGALCNAGNTLNVIDSVFAGNSVSSFGGSGGSGGGAIVNLMNGTVNILRSTFSDNSAEGLGGGVGEGGAIYNNNSGTVNLTNSTLAGNTAFGAAGLGGAVGNGGAGRITVTNSTLFDNSASSYAVTGLGAGGGLYAGPGPGTVTVTNATIAGNSASGDLAFGGGLYSGDPAARVILQNTLVAGNAARGNSQTLGPDVARNFTSRGYNLIGKGDGGNGFSASQQDQIGSLASPLDPGLDPGGLRNNGGPTATLALLPFSPAIDAGSSANDPVTQQGIFTDQRGFRRPVDDPGTPNVPGGNLSDIGAFEYLSAIFPTITPVTAAVQQGSAPLRLQIATVSESDLPAITLKVTAGAATGSGVTVSNLAVESDGRVFADVAAGCAATPSTFTLTVTDNRSASAIATLTVTVSADTPPTLGSYPPILGPLNPGTGASLTPSAAPTDNGTFGLTASAPGFGGALSVSSTTGVVTVSNAKPSGAYTVTVAATDNCNLTSTRAFILKVNQPPTLAVQAVSRQQGTLPGAPVKIASVQDAEDPAITLRVTVNGEASATVNGVTLSNLTVGPAGAVRANLVAACGASAADFTLTVTDSGHLSASAQLHVTVSSNTPPALGVYPATVSLGAGRSLTVVPNGVATDNGAISSLTVAASQGFTGSLSTTPANGGVNIFNAKPIGTYRLTVTARDNCGVPTTRTFTLKVTLF